MRLGNPPRKAYFVPGAVLGSSALGLGGPVSWCRRGQALSGGLRHGRWRAAQDSFFLLFVGIVPEVTATRGRPNTPKKYFAAPVEERAFAEIA